MMNLQYEISRKKVTILVVSLSLLTLSFMTGCSFDEPTAIIDKRAEVVQELYQAEVPTSDVTEGALKQVARHYASHGEGPVEIMVSYNPNSSRNSAMVATENVSRMGRVLNRNGVHNIKSEILPVKDSERSMTYIGYVSYIARAPSDCKSFNDIDDSKHMNFDEYKLGCTTETYLAKQVARPKDLLGNGEPMSDADGRRLGSVVEWGYKWGGESNESLEGEQAAEE